MSGKIYPAIYKPYIGALYLYIDENNFCELDDNEWLTHSKHDKNQHSSDRNITREYLEGKCVKIESPEHSELVQKLGFNAGFKWRINGTAISHTNGDFLIFYEGGIIEFSATNHGGRGEITIPLPPEAEPESKEWPAIGDEVKFKTNPSNDATIIATVKYIGDKFTILKSESGREFSRRNSKLILSKPKTEAEILRDEIYHVILNRGDSNIAASAATNDLLEQFNITKKPQ